MAKSSVDKLRAATVGSTKNFASEKVEWNGNEFEIRQPSVAKKSKIMSKCRIPLSEGDESEFTTASLDYGEMQVWSVIYCTFDPETGERIFEEDDYPNLREQPSGGFVDRFSSVAMRLMNVQPEEDAKN